MAHIRQAGATDIVSALHDIPIGQVWPIEAIQEHKNRIEHKGLNWSVVESIPVHDDIKRRSGDFKSYIENYKQSLVHLAQCGIPVVTYNFMPVLDWSRTDLGYELPSGSKALRFERAAFDAFELFILKREGCASEIGPERVTAAEIRFAQMNREERDRLTQFIIAGLPGKTTAASDSMDAFKDLLESYAEIDAERLRENLILFLQEIVPVAEEHNIRLSLHPDDPPFSLLGLPRVVSSESDLLQIMSGVTSEANGICFCTGSLGVLAENDLSGMIERLGERIHFVHLRSTKRNQDGDFYEADHLTGDVDMYGVMKALIQIQKKRGERIPMRPDHGHQMLDDLGKITNPGYSAIGRLKGLAELTGLEMGILESMKRKSL